MWVRVYSSSSLHTIVFFSENDDGGVCSEGSRAKETGEGGKGDGVILFYRCWRLWIFPMRRLKTDAFCSSPLSSPPPSIQAIAQEFTWSLFPGMFSSGDGEPPQKLITIQEREKVGRKGEGGRGELAAQEFRELFGR